MVVGLDLAIREITNRAKEILGDNTVIVVSSDNGANPWLGGMNAPFRSGKLSPFEGGVRVPAFAFDLSSDYKYLEKGGSVVLYSTHPPVCDQWGLSVKRMVLELGLDQPTSWLAWSTMPPVQKNRCASWAISRLNSFCLSGVSRDTGSMPARDTC